MSIIVKRATKGSALTSGEIDANVNNLNNDKVEINNPTFKAAPSLVNNLIPLTGTVLPAIYPSLNLDFANGKQLDPRITFSRNTVATYYDGKSVAVAEQNLLLQSNMGISPWFGLASLSPVVTANTATAPDGTTTATSLLFSAQYQNRIQTVSAVIGLTYTFSFYAQNITGNTALTIFYDSGLFSAITTTASWARHSITFVASIVNPSFGIQDRNSSGFGTTLVWGAQLEQRSSATAYTPTTSSPITNYIPVLKTASAGVPRFDYDPITKKPLGLLIEEGRTNLLTYSSDFSNAAWIKSNSTVTSAANVAPDGTQTAFNLIEDALTNIHAINQNPSGTTAIGAYTLSVYAKYNGRQLRLVTSLNGGSSTPIFNLQTGVVISGTGTITSVGNGWYRCTSTATSTGSSAGYAQYIQTAKSDGAFNYTGDGYSGIYIWGAQLEAGAFATSYIPTVATTVTRAADQASMTGTNFSSWYNQAQGSLYAEGDTVSTVNALLAIISDGSTSNLLGIGHGASTNTANSYYNSVLQTNFGSLGVVWNIKTVGKVILSLSTNNSNAACNGVAGTVDTVCTMPSNVTRLDIGSWVSVSGVQPLNGHIRKLSYYPRALSSSELQGLTS